VINLAPLSDDQTAQLISSLLGGQALPVATQRVLLERAGGNPLYAEEFVRLLADRDLFHETVEDVPGSVQALIAARLDTLPSRPKSVLQDAAVIGKVFWPGALHAMNGSELDDVELVLDELCRRHFIRAERTSSLEGESEFSFSHLLVRDVCYAQIPRSSRAARHRAAAGWIERKGADRAEDLADVVAHHYLRALELGRAIGQEVEDLEASACRYLALAGRRALALDVGSAESNLAKALELVPPGDPERARLLEHWAEAAQQQGRQQEAKEALEEALDTYRAEGAAIAAGRTLTALALTLGRLGDPRREQVLSEALALLEAEPPGHELVSALAQLAGRRELDGAFVEAIAAADQALALAAELGIVQPARALGFRGSALANSGDPGGLEEMRRALDLSVAQGKGREAAVLYNNLAVDVWQYEGPRAALTVCREGIEFCRRRGIVEFEFAIAGASLMMLADSGDVALALAEAKPVAERAEAAGMVPDLIEARAVQVRWTAERGEQETDLEAARNLIAIARETDTLPLVAEGFAAAAQAFLAKGSSEEARELLIDLDELRAGRSDPLYAALLPHLLRLALALGEPELGARLVDGVVAFTSLSEHAVETARAQLAEGAGMQAEAAALYAEAAERWHVFGNVPERAYALLGQGRCLAALGKPEAEAPLRVAHELFASLGYEPALAETAALLAETLAAAS
jgi:tetratricopeptide (TPR) repeat protein